MAQDTNTKDLIIPNTFDRGLDTDAMEGSQPSGSYRHARGVVLATADHGKAHYIANEAAQRFCAKLPDGYTMRGWHGIEERDWFVVASVDADGAGEIGYFDVKNCTYNPIIKDGDIEGCGLSLSMEEWVMDMESKVLQPCNSMTLYYSSDHTYYQIPIDEILEGRQKLPMKCADVMLFSCPCVPTVNIRASQTGGVDLPGGAYKAAVQLEDADGNTTNWFPLSNTAYLGSENNRNGEAGRGSLAISIDAIGGTYEYLNIAVVSQSGGGTTAKVVARVAHGNSGVGIVYRSQKQIVRDISIEELLVKKPGYLRGKGLVQHKGHLFLYALRGERNLNYQKRALDIKTSYEMGLVPSAHAGQFSGHRGGEVRAYTLRWNFCDGTYTRDFVLRSHAPQEEGAVECEECIDPYANTKGKRQGNPVEDGYRRAWLRTPDSYEPFVPTDQNLLDQDDADMPNIDPIRNLGQGGNDDCDCEGVNAMSGFTRFLVNRALDTGLANRGPVWRPRITQSYDILAAIEIKEKQCRCEGDDGELQSELGLAFQPAPSNTEFNDADVERLRSSYAEIAIEDGLSSPVPTALEIKEVLSVKYNYFQSDTDSELTIHHNKREEVIARASKLPSSGSTSSSLTTSTDDEPTTDPNGCFGSAGNGTGGETGGGGGGGGGGNTLSLTTSASPPEPEEPNTPDCEDDITAGGVPPDYESEVTNTGVDSDYPKPLDTYSGVTQGGFTGGEPPAPYTPCKPTIIYDDDCCTIKEIIPCIDGAGDLAYWESCEKYPTQLDCKGEPIFGEFAGKPIRHIKMPGRDVEPHIISYQDGVPTQHNRDNFEGNDTYVRLFWLRLDNITPPDPEELDKPLCPFNPFTISAVPLDASNKTIIASGVALNLFEAQVNGNPTLFPRNGVNGVAACDRYVNNNGSRRGNDEIPTTPAFVFHSPDTAFDRPSLEIDTVHFRQNLTGKGYKHGLYQQGEMPDSINVGRKNRKGCRNSAHLNHWELTPGQVDCAKAAAYLSAGTFGDRADDFSRSISNLYRESSVYFETEGDPRGTLDTSFDGLVSQHERSFETTGLYVDLRRNIPNQYGSVTSMAVSPLHQGTKKELAAGSCTVRAGGAFVNRMSVKRTSYVSDKVGADITPPFEFGGGVAELPIISRLLKWFFSTIGGEECGTVPVSGNTDDPRNNDSLNGLSGTNDTYFPAVQKTLLTFWVESEVNLEFRGGSDDGDEAHYRDLAGLALDSSMGGGDSEDDYYLNRFYATLDENPKWRMVLRMLFNTFFTYVVGILIIIKGTNLLMDAVSRFIVGLSTSVGIVIAAFGAALLILLGILWIILWVNTNLDNRFIDQLLGVNSCFPDFRGTGSGSPWRMFDKRLRQWKSNYYNYSYDFSSSLPVEISLVIPDPYNTCDCLNEVGTTVYYSNKQNAGSWTDAYRNFQAISYLEIPSSTGRIQKMFSRSDTLYALTTDMPYQLSIGNAQLNTDGVAIGLKPVAVVTEPNALFGGVPEGHGGILDRNAVRNTVLGFVWIDREAGVMYRLSGSRVDAISLAGIQVDMDDYLRFELLDAFPDYKGSVDQKLENGIGFEIGYDPGLGRLILTKHDYLPNEGVTYNAKKGEFLFDGSKVGLDSSSFCNHSVTFSYDFSRGTWIGEHEYKPQVYLSDRRYMYSMHKGGLWIHDAHHREYMKVYDEPSDMYIEFVIHTSAATGIRERMTYDSTEIVQDVRSLDRGEHIEYIRDSFDKVHMWSPHGSTNIRDVLLDDNQSKEERAEFGETEADYSFLGRRVRLNTLSDLRISPNQAVFAQNCDLFDRTPATENHKTVGERRNMVSDYFVMGLRRLPEHTRRFYLEAVLTKVKTKEL